MVLSISRYPQALYFYLESIFVFFLSNKYYCFLFYYKIVLILRNITNIINKLKCVMKKKVHHFLSLLIMIPLLGIGTVIYADEINFTTSYETKSTSTEQFSMKIKAKSGTKYYIDYGDGTGTHEKISYGNADLLSYNFADMAVNKIHKVKVWGGPFIEFTIISNRKVSEITLTDCKELLKFSCAWSSLKKLDLTGCPKLENVVCNANEIEDLKLPPTTRNFVFDRNRLTLAEFPEKKTFVYTYGPMRPVYLEKNKIKGMTVDLSDFLSYKGTISKFSWYRYNNRGNNADPAMLIDPSTYKEEDGIFTFNEAYDCEIYCVVDNPALPKLHNINDRYGIMPIKLAGKSKGLDAVHAAFTTDKFTTEKLTFDLTLSSTTDNSPCLINWGDGVIQEITLNKSETIVKHNFLDAEFDKKHLVQIQCKDLDLLKFPELSGFCGFNEGTVESPAKRIILDNNRLQSVDFSLFKNAIELSANGCYASEIILPKTKTIIKLSLAGNQINALNLSDYVNLTDLNIERNKLTAVNLTKMNKLERVNIAFNQINDLKLPADYSLLKEMRCGHNAIPMYMLPEKRNMENYLYAPQRPYFITPELIRGNVVDLSAFNHLKGVTNAPQPTTYIWLNKNVAGLPVVKGLYYEEVDGKFTFKLTEETEMYCSMQTDAFPDLSIAGKEYRTRPVTMKAAASSISYVNENKRPIKLWQNGNLITLSANKDAIVNVYDIQGKQVDTLSVKNKGCATLHLIPGVYIVKTNNNGVFKFVVQ